jgi:AraC-like DNA-binding protein
MPSQNTRATPEENVGADRLPAARSNGKPGHTPYLENGSPPSWESLATGCGYRLPELARVCHVSMRTLQRHFRKHYHTTLSEWVRELRLDRARAMLAEAESVKCVAFELGYKQPSHFTRDFKQRFGVPPRAFRWPFSIKFQVSPAKGEKT